MNQNTFQKLEYFTILEKLKNKCSSELGKQIAEELRPFTDLEIVVRMQKETSEAVTIRRFEGSLPLGGISDTFTPLRLAEKGGILNTEEIGKIRGNLYAAKNISTFFNRKLAYEVPLFREKVAGITTLRELELAIEGILDEENQIKDSASDALWNIRRKKRSLNEKIRTRLEQIIKNPNTNKYLQENIITVRQGRFVVPVKVEYRPNIPGIIHDQSASGATLFVEPAPIVEMNNDLRKAEIEEEEEITKILLEISGKIALEAETLRVNLEILAQLDFIYGRGALSGELDCEEPVILSQPVVRIKNGRHPLIPRKEVVPISLELGDAYDALVVTGPNTGGKTVSIKTTGLFVMMAQSGLHVPAESAATGIFTGVFCDIGDEQSIEQSLSTFSSHMTNIVKIIQAANNRSLVLLDELGAGTDPSEGANLAIAIIRFFLNKGSKIIATTHYSDLKIFAYNTDRVENASVEFDTGTLRPTYRLLIGIPGKSNALAIASRLGLPEEIIATAREMVTTQEKDVAGLIEKLEHDAYYGAQNLEMTQKRLAMAEKKLADAEEKEKQLREKEARVIQKAEEEAYRIVRDAKREMAEQIRQIRESMEEDKQKALELAGEARISLEEKEGSLYERLMNKSPVERTGITGQITVGMEVFVPKFSQKATVLSAGESEVLLQVGIMKVKVAPGEVSVLPKSQKKATKSGFVKLQDEKVMNIRTELDLRGATVEEALDMVDKYLDDARIAGLHSVSLIHGKGTGALRTAIQNHLRGHRAVSKSRMGESTEGGYGVTVVELR